MNTLLQKRQFSFFLALAALLFFSNTLSAQEDGSCQCTNCPQFMPDNFIGDFNLNVIGGTNNDLSNPNQGVCGVNLLFDHQYLGDLAISLTSPSGQSITLVGPVGLFGDTDLSTWDVSFVPCSETPSPDPGQPTTWNNALMLGTDWDWEGSYHPNVGCLEDFNTGPINGTWTLTVVDGQAVDVGTFLDFEIVFCDDSGINCNSNPCGLFASVDYESIFCSGETVVIDASASVGSTFEWSTADGNIEGPTNGPTIVATTGGTYIVTVSNNGQCPEQAIAILTEIPEVPDVVITQDVPFGCTNTTVTLDGENDQFDGLFYAWFEGTENDITENSSPLSNDPTLTVTEPGTYTLAIINIDAACAGYGTYIVEDDSEYPTATAGVSGMIDCTNTEVSLMGDSDGNFDMYEWSGPNSFTSGLQNPDISEGGDYFLTVTNDSGCTATATVTVESNSEEPTVTIDASNEIDCSMTSSILQTNSATTDLTYTWSGPDGFVSDQASPVINEGGTYDLVVTATNGCIGTATIIVAEESDLPDVSIEPPVVLDCNTTTLDLIANSTTPDVTYQWVGVNGFNANTATATNITEAGTYTLVVTASNNCSQIASVEVFDDNTEPEATALIDGSFDCNNTQVNLQGTSTTAGNIDYAWTGPNGFTANTANAMTSENGTYTLIVTAENGCTSIATIATTEDIAEPDIATSVSEMLTCQITQVQIEGTSTTSDVSYAWTGPNGFNAMEANPFVENAGTYILTVTAQNGCTSTQTLEVQEDGDLPTASVTGNTLSCNNQVVSIEGTSSDPSVTYAWTGPNGYTSSVANPDDITTEGDYELTITASNGCTDTAVALVDLDDAQPDLNIDAPTGDLIGCANTSVELIGSASATSTTLAWSFGGSALTGTAVTVDQSGIYTLIATGANGCTNQATIEVFEDFNEPQNIETTEAIIDCNGPQMIAVSSSTPDVTYAWSGPNGFSATDAAPMVNEVGAYSVTITGANECTTTATLMVDGNFSEPDADATGNTLDCATENVLISGNSTTAGVMYEWSGPGNYTSSDQNPMVNTAGTYTLTVTGTNGCTNTSQAVVLSDENAPNAFAETVGANAILDCNIVEVELMGSTNTPNATTSWVLPDDSTQSTSNIMASVAGVYTLIVAADNGCTSQATVTVSDNYETPQDLMTEAGLIYCDPNETQIDISSSTNGVSYSWTGPDGFTSIFQNPMVSESGLYTAVATGANGCTSTTSIEVMADLTQASIDLDAEALTCTDPETMIQSSSDQIDLMYQWSGPNGFTSDEANPLVETTGDYTVVVTSALNGCTSESTITVASDANLPEVTIQGQNIDCNQPEASLQGISTNTDIVYEWSGPNNFTSTDTDVTADVSGVYMLTVTSANGCTDVAEYEVIEDFVTPQLTAEGGTITCASNFLQLSANSDAVIVNYEWTGPNNYNSTEQNPTVTDAGQYELTVQAENGCVASESAQVNLDDGIPALMAFAETITCDNPAVILDGLSSTPAGDSISYQWYLAGTPVGDSGELNPTISNAGAYELVGMNMNNQCGDTLTYTVQENVIPPSANAGADMTITCDEPVVSIDGSASSGQGTLSYSWLDENQQEIEQAALLELSVGGDFTLIITDAANGCQDMDDVFVEVDNLSPEIAIVEPETITCDQPIIALIGSNVGAGDPSDLDYTWTDSANEVLGSSTDINVSEAGTYSLSIDNTSNGCMANLSIEVSEDTTSPTAEIQIPEILNCINEEIVLDGSESSSGGIYTYSWDAPNNGIVSDADGITPTVQVAGVYTLTVENLENGCTEAASVQVLEDNVPPEVVASAMDILDCTTDEVTLSGQGSSEGNQFDYTWSGNNVQNPSELNATATEAGNYILSILNTQNGCTAQATVEVQINDNYITDALIEVADEVCSGDDNGVVVFSSVEGGTPPYLYAFDGDAFTSNSQYTNLTPGTYPLSIQDVAGCTYEETITIEAASPVVLDLGDDITVGLGESINLNPQSNIVVDSIEWSLPEFQGLTPMVTPAGTTVVEATIMDDNGCEDSDMITIFVERNRPVFIPSAFSPNGDGVNDAFMIYGGDVIANIRSFMIVDRWGTIIHQRQNIQPNDVEQGWDGLFRDKELKPAVFIYYAEIEFIDGIVEVFKGDVSLIR